MSHMVASCKGLGRRPGSDGLRRTDIGAQPDATLPSTRQHDSGMTDSQSCRTQRDETPEPAEPAELRAAATPGVTGAGT